MGYKVNVIDDNEIFLQSIQQNFNWEELDCHLEGIAKDGLSGQKLIVETRPDIIITDINMPGLDGLSMIGNIRKDLPNVKIIIVTGYDYFDYALKALQQHVDAFLLKPISTDIMKDTVTKIVMELKNNNEEKQQVHNLKQQLDNNLKTNEALRREQTVQLLINVAVSADNQIQKRLDQGNLYNGGYSIFVVQVLNGAEPIHILQQISERVKEMQYSGDEVQTVSIFDDNRFVITVLYKEPVGQETVNRSEYNLIIQLNQFNQIMYSYISSVSAGFEMFRIDYLLTVAKLEQSIYFKDVGCGENKSGTDSQILEDRKMLVYFEEHIENIMSCSSEEAQKKLEQVVENVSLRYSQDISLIKSTLLVFSILLMHKTDGMEFRLEQIALKFNEVTDINQTKDFLYGVYEECVDIKRGNRRRYSFLVNQFFEYIQTHKYEEISLYSAANYLQVSPGYLSGLIKRETGSNFKDIIVRERIKASKKLLENPRYSIEQISEKVGYKNYINYYKVFKKLEGISPKEYKNSYAKKQKI